MPLRDILVHLDATADCATRLAAACGLASRHGATLIGLHAAEVMTPAGLVTASGRGADLYDVSYTQWQQQVAQTDADLRAAFDAALTKYGIAGAWRTEQGPVADSVASHARFADITIIGQTPAASANMGTAGWLVEKVLLTSGRPVLVMPHVLAATHPDQPHHILIGWDGSRAAVRAVHDAMPLLRHAKRVTIMSIADGKGDGGIPLSPATDIAPHLARHDVRVEAASVPREEAGVAATLLRQAAELHADLLVAGGYGHSRLREFVLGGATRQILLEMTVPVLLSH
jgi:nucleotide-binding universal stress UspA family protein